MANENSLDILVRFMLDEAANARVKAGVSSINDELKKIGASVSKETEKGFDGLDKKIKETEQAAKRTYATLLAEAKALSAEANVITNNLKQAQIQALRGVAGQIEGVSKLALGTGAALVGGILGFANKYVNSAKEATDTTIAWKAAQEDLNKAGNRFGAVLAQEALPLLKQAAALAGQVADFVETHPDAIRAALNTGKILIALGAIGTLAAKGIKLVADVQYLATIPAQLAAAKLQDLAADKQLLAAKSRLTDIGAAAGLKTAAPVAGVGGLAAGGLVITAAVGTAAAVLGALIGDAVTDAVTGRDTSFNDYVTTFKQTLAIEAKLLTELVAGQDAGNAAFKAVAVLLGLRSAPSVPSGGGEDNKDDGFRGVLKAYEKYKAQDLKLVEEHYKEREKVLSAALEAEKKSNTAFSKAIGQANRVEQKNLTDARKQYNDADAKAEATYRSERARIIRDGGQEIQQIESDLQERLRKLRLESGEREEELIASRDALGLAKERRALINSENEENRSANNEVKQRRADIAQQLEDASAAYMQERHARFEDYQAKLLEIKENAEAQRSELRAQHRAELQEIQSQKNARLRELNDALNEERKRRYQGLLTELRDTDTGLILEKNLRKKYQDIMIGDLDRFLAAYRSKSGGVLKIPGLAEGGYTSGLVMSGERGVEWMASHSTTRAAEQIVGGRLTQENVLAAMMGRGGGVTWNDNRSFSGEYTNAIRNANRRDTVEMLAQALRG